MTNRFPFLFLFLLLVSAAAAQNPAASASPAKQPAVQQAGADTLPLPVMPKRKVRAPFRDSLVLRHPDSLHRMPFRFTDSIRRKRALAGDSLRARAPHGADSAGTARGHAAPDAAGARVPPPDSPGGAWTPVYRDSLLFSSTRPDYRPWPLQAADLLKSNPFLNFSGEPRRMRDERYQAESYDGLFYLLVGMLFFFAIVKRAFGKYLGNLLTLFFRVSMRQQQIREQVLQSPFPSLLLNVLFALSGGLYGAFLLLHMHYGRPDQFWQFFLYGVLILSAIYGVKFVFLKITGWIFNIKRAVETYLFIVFMTNKVIGIFLLPFLIILSVSSPLISAVCITLSAVGIGLFYFYRIVASYKALRKEIKISGLHFFLYLCAFEIAPLLLIYKVLLTNLGKAH